MKWDIDKALAMLAADNLNIPNATLHTILVDGGRLSGDLKGLKPHKDKSLVKCLGLGRLGGPMVHFYGWTVREAYLLARKGLHSMSAEELNHYGLKSPKKRKNSYAAARRKPRK